jgi:hypothetical protein
MYRGLRWLRQAQPERMGRPRPNGWVCRLSPFALSLLKPFALSLSKGSVCHLSFNSLSPNGR